MNKLDIQYQNLLKDILKNGVEKADRTGTGTKSVFGKQIHHDMAEGFPLLTTKKMPFKTIATELMWFLQGDTNIKYLLKNNCHIWSGDAYKNYVNDPVIKAQWDKGGDIADINEFENLILSSDEFAEKWGELGPIYGKQWRSWQDIDWLYIDQIQNLIRDLKTNPDSRRLMVSAWNVGELNDMVLPPCHYGFQVYTREMELEERIWRWCLSLGHHPSYGADLEHEDLDERGYPKRIISLMWNQRSVDTFLGLPFNIASYGLLLVMLAKEVNMLPGHLIGSLGDVHLYNNHIEQACEQISREPKQLPILKLSSGHNLRAALRGKPEEIDLNDFMLIDYDPYPTIKAPLSN